MLNKLILAAESVSTVTGRCIAWLTLFMMALTCVIVLLRYGFGYGSIAMQESVLYLHAMVFMLGAAYTFKADEHVRVDVFYRGFSVKKKALVNTLGGLFFLLPFCVFTLYMSLDYVMASWRVFETSPQPGGLAYVYLLKTLIPIMMLTLIIQGIADILKNLAVITGHNPVEGH
ncbi:TRAP transporter small permease subunit [Marinomonas mediterranea]|jgi:TRAP-type mannitol/chloroaromatic compound transport system, small permease component|uniref:TRAP transporter small permease protein n=1 Tax=Marinomonas mediterranea (strain ATCC 700492 / JCM 21426 / NBRC 103028 / MMB-1) TaxID=717774 RepID=F2K113_MARM1|nr:TRAP transporter small permease subunit [Marinomonas mediterranea]ADZ93362.1 Tripartite ATP-independent periplasmic transporter DctQ component [Marinomonas mediterranea MMB-1]WCN11250.1 TRAP transporter small permease subunit [Marinomonas mediterranea]WCN15314.1 TRAP transporter small permease subunit [Marinomonas mediterranea]WCN19358.1 TRAP transporter small permease subunit [Marinomonas mediterranea MMB-1]